MIELERDILSTGVLQRQFVLEEGVLSNNHLSLDTLWEYEKVSERLVNALSCLVLHSNCKIDFIASMPGSAESWATKVGEKIDVPDTFFDRIKANQDEYEIRDVTSYEIINQSRQGVVLEDISKTLSSLSAVIGNRNLKNKELSYVAIWRIGNELTEEEIDITKHWLIEDPIPVNIERDSKFWPFMQRR
jgi:hypothetical protein